MNQVHALSHKWLKVMSMLIYRSQKFVDAVIAENKIAVFSKSYCPHCAKAKEALKAVGVNNYKLVELDQRDDGDAIQDYLLKLTNGRTVSILLKNLMK